MSFESVFCRKTFNRRLFKKYLNKEKKKSRAQFCLSHGWLHISEKKLEKTAILLVQGLIKKLIFGPTLTLIFPIFGKREKGKLYILKKVGRYDKKHVYNSTFMFLACFYFA